MVTNYLLPKQHGGTPQTYFNATGNPSIRPSWSPCTYLRKLSGGRLRVYDNVPESVVSDAGVGGEADDGESLRGGDLRRKDGGRAAAELAQALGSCILTLLKKIYIQHD